MRSDRLIWLGMGLGAIVGLIFGFMAGVTAVRGDEPKFTPLDHAKEPLVLMVLQEAANEPFEGLVGAAGVALDRVKDPRWPNTLRKVLYQPYQFTGLHIRIVKWSRAHVTRARAAVAMARAGARPCGKVLWYHLETIKPKWSLRLKRRCKLGRHIFYEDK